jgi:hypothetical protein
MKKECRHAWHKHCASREYFIAGRSTTWAKTPILGNNSTKNLDIRTKHLKMYQASFKEAHTSTLLSRHDHKRGLGHH